MIVRRPEIYILNIKRRKKRYTWLGDQQQRTICFFFCIVQFLFNLKQFDPGDLKSIFHVSIIKFLKHKGVEYGFGWRIQKRKNKTLLKVLREIDNFEIIWNLKRRM